MEFACCVPKYKFLTNKIQVLSTSLDLLMVISFNLFSLSYNRPKNLGAILLLASGGEIPKKETGY